MATIKFRVIHKTENAQIYLRFSLSRDKVLQTKTGKTINPGDWGKNSKPKQTSAELKNLSVELSELETHIQKKYNDDYSKGVIFTNDWLKDGINNFFNRIDEKADSSIFLNYLDDFISFKRNNSSHTVCTLRKFVNLQDRFTEYEHLIKKNYLIQDIDAKTLINFKKYLINDCNLLETTATRFIKNFKTVIFDARHNGKKIHHQIAGFKTGTTNTEYKVFLSFDEINEIKNVRTLIPEWNTAKDWLVIGCFLGQRASDLLRMNKSMIYTKTDSTGISFRFIEITQQKTGEKVVIPLHDEVETILRKYDGNFPPKFAENPDSNAVLFNKHLKTVCELAKIFEVVKGKVYNETKKKNEIAETEKYKLVSSHVCRRSFATNFYGNKNFTTPELMKITGHKSEAMFLNYIGKTADDWAMQTAKTFKKISNKKIS